MNFRKFCKDKQGDLINIHVSNGNKTKIIFQFFLIYVFGAIVGWSFFKFAAQPYFDSIRQAILIHFELPFRFVHSIWEGMGLVVRYAWWDICCVLVVFLISFTPCRYLLTQLFLLWRATKFGVVIASLHWLYKTSDFFPSGLKCFLFVFTNVIILLLLLCYAVRGTRLWPKKDILCEFFVRTIAVCALLLLLYSIYCFFIFIL